MLLLIMCADSSAARPVNQRNLLQTAEHEHRIQNLIPNTVRLGGNELTKRRSYKWSRVCKFAAGFCMALLMQSLSIDCLSEVPARAIVIVT